MPLIPMTKLHDNKKISMKIRVDKLKEEGIEPLLWILTDGLDKQCAVYMKSKLNMGNNELNIKTEVITILSEEHLINVLEEADEKNIAIIMQLPINKLYKDIYETYRINSDIDGFFSFQELSEGIYDIIPATPKGIYEFLTESKENGGLSLNLRNKFITIVGRGKLVGYPLSMMFLNEGATISIINTKTNIDNRKYMLENSDIVILCTGINGSVSDYELSKDKEVYVINVGTCFDENNKLTTELKITENYDNIFYTDRIKAVGVSTVLSLFDNLLNFYEKQL